VSISLPGYLHVDNFDEFFDLDVSSDLDSIMRGGTAAVQKGHIKDKSLVEKHGFTDIAVKVMYGDPEAENGKILDNFKYEVSIMASLPNSPNLVKFIGFCLKPMTIIMKHYQFSLFDIMKEPNFKNSLGMKMQSATDIARGMEIIHSKHIVHLDLKPGKVSLNWNFLTLSR